MLLHSTDHLKYEAIKRCNIVQKLQSITDFQVTIHTFYLQYGKTSEKTCDVCFKAMRSDKLKTHMKKHERVNEDNIVTKGPHEGKTEDKVVTEGVHDGKTEDNVVTNGQHKGCTSVTFNAEQKSLIER